MNPSFSLVNLSLGFVWFTVTITLIYLMGREVFGGKQANPVRVLLLIVLWACLSIIGYHLMVV